MLKRHTVTYIEYAPARRFRLLRQPAALYALSGRSTRLSVAVTGYAKLHHSPPLGGEYAPARRFRLLRQPAALYALSGEYAPICRRHQLRQTAPLSTLRRGYAPARRFRLLRQPAALYALRHLKLKVKNGKLKVNRVIKNIYPQFSPFNFQL